MINNLKAQDQLEISLAAVSGSTGGSYTINLLDSAKQSIGVSFSGTYPATHTHTITLNGNYFIQVVGTFSSTLKPYQLTVKVNTVAALKIVDALRA